MPTKTKTTQKKTTQKKLTPAQQLMAFARKKVSECQEWPDLHNAVYGVGALFSQLFPTVSARTAFAKSVEFREISKLIESLPGPGREKPSAPLSGKLLVRLPTSLHKALTKEAAEEGVSLNQLIVAKVAAQLRDVVRA